MKNSGLQFAVIAVICALTLNSCEGYSSIEDNLISGDVRNPNSALNTNFDGAVFGIPSPIQTGYLIKELKLSFDAKLGNDPSKVHMYDDEYSQSLNLGIYGVDLGYSALYDQKNITLNYLASVEKLTNQLGLGAAFDTDFLKSFESKIDDEKEMIHLMSEAFKKADNFLKNSNRKAASALILTGGWLESIYLACQLNAKNPKHEIKQRIGEQKQSIGTIIAVLTEYNNNSFHNDLIEQLNDLSLSFDKIIIKYEYAAPEIDIENKTTTLMHSTEIDFKNEIVKEIKTKIEAIRLSIIYNSNL
tara:strand:- start:445 stop:1350 length:906 start_codon:yes stop_codon:yes gene_type:complete